MKVMIAAGVVGLISIAGEAGLRGAPPIPAEQQDAAWASRECVDDARGGWFRDAKFGTFIHFGAYSQLGGYYKGKGPYRPAEQIIGLGERRAVIPPEEYRKDVAGAFNPEKFDAKQWVRLMKKAGQKYVIFTAKHHDGFCMFKTATTSYNVVESSPLGRDVVRELAEACREEGLEFCPYFSIGDWCAADVCGAGFEKTGEGYREYMLAQIRELVTGYGKVRMLWFDNYWYVNGQWKNDEAHAKDLYSYVRSIDPGIIVNDRCGRGAESEDGDYATPENQLKGSLQERYFEVVMTNTADDNWGWVRGATNYRTAEEIIANLIDCASKGGNFVLNVGPTAEGELPPEHVALLEKIGAWTSVNGGAIYATVPAPEVGGQGAGGGGAYHATRSKDGGIIYLHVAKWPDNGTPLEVPISRAGVRAVELQDEGLASSERLGWFAREGNGVTTLSIHRPARVDPLATVVRVKMGGEAGK